MRTQVLSYVESCLLYTAAQAHTPPIPLNPNLLPGRPWQRLHADFKGPIKGRYYLYVIIDQYSKYPEVGLVTSTSFKKLKPVLDHVFATHGYPETVTADNGLPYSSYEMEKYAKGKGFRLPPVTPDDPQCDGFVESFVKVMCKLLHTAVSKIKIQKQSYTTIHSIIVLLHIVPQDDVFQQSCFSTINFRQNYLRYLLSRNVMI